MFQAVKHHCANMLVATELATAAVWDAARAAECGGDQLTYAAALAADARRCRRPTCAPTSTPRCTAASASPGSTTPHLYCAGRTVLRRAARRRRGREPTSPSSPARASGATKDVDLPPEAEAIRDEVRSFAERSRTCPADEQRDKLIETGYVMPHWPTPWGRDAGAVEQLVIEQEFAAAGVERPNYGITGWVILTLIQHATDDQVARWVPPRPATRRSSGASCSASPTPVPTPPASRRRRPRVDGGWMINGQKVWTSGAHLAGFGFATVRTNPDVPKHDGITTMVIDMHAPGVEVRPLQMTTGQSEFNEVFFTDVFVPDDDVVGPVDGGWTVARATLGNESVSIGGGQGGMSCPAPMLVPAFDAHPERLAGGAAAVGRYIAEHAGDGPAQPAQRAPRRRRRRARSGGRDHQARAVRARPRGRRRS